MSVDIDVMYKNAPAVLWVEDPETRDWLDAVWQGEPGPSVRLLVAGGRSNVTAVCEQAREAGYSHVFGLVDRDFGGTNHGRWTTLDPRERVYRLDVHEVENLLLDSDALAGCDLNKMRENPRTSQKIENKLFELAKGRTWWVACVRFLAKTRREATAKWPPSPGEVRSLAEAERYICSSGWFTQTAKGCAALVKPQAVVKGLEDAHATAIADLKDGSWKESFPGKELFRAISSFVLQSGMRLDLVKSVGIWQRKNAKIPPQAIELLNAILARISSRTP